MSDQKKIKQSLNEISNDISQLEKEKNISVIMKQYNKINTDIKNTSSKIYKLKNKFEDINKGNDKNNITEEQYEEIKKKLSEDEIAKILNCDDLDLQIEEYQKMHNNIELCKKYLESKKINVINCDEIVANQNEAKTKKVYGKKKVAELMSDSSLSD